MIGSNIELVRQRIERDQERGLIAPGVDAAITAAFVTWGVERTIDQHIEAGGSATDEQLAAAMACAIWKAVYGDRLDRVVARAVLDRSASAAR